MSSLKMDISQEDFLSKKHESKLDLVKIHYPISSQTHASGESET